jgi:probable HAF family extracellular repeat protein
MIRKVALGLFATIVLAVSTPAQSYYEVQNIGVLSGQTSSTALDINNKGVVVGQSGNRAFIYKDCMLGDIGTLGGNSASAEAISKDGTIVGVSTRSDGKKRAFMRQGGIMWDLGGASNFEESAFAISSWNLPVGIESVSGLAATEVWYFNNRTIALPQILVNPPSGFANVQHVTDVNDSLQVTGFLDNPQIGVVSAPGFGQWTRIQGIPGLGSAVKPLAINNNGHVVGAAGGLHRTRSFQPIRTSLQRTWGRSAIQHGSAWRRTSTSMVGWLDCPKAPREAGSTHFFTTEPQ